jgi:D-alanyl-D-alanine carboxypeptidase
MKKIFYPAQSAVMAVSFIFLFSNTALAQLQPAIADSFLNFINGNKSRVSVYVTVNDTPVIHLNENKLMPLASTVKILVACEFANQVAHEMINENSFVQLSELEKYYIPDTDGGAHPAWLEYEKNNNHIHGDSIRLIDVARGMIMFSSNANAEYLMDLVGFDAVKDNILLFKLKHHTAIFPLVGSLFIYQIPKKSNEEKTLKSINKYSDKQYSLEAYDAHMQLKEDSSFKASFKPQDLTPKMQKLWSDRLPASTTKDYVMIAQALNNKELLDEEAFFTIGETLEYPMENKAFSAVFKHYGAKGGSTPYVLTHVFYLTMKDGTRMESAIFFNDLAPEEEKKLEGWLDPFEAQMVFDKTFRGRVKL